MGTQYLMDTNVVIDYLDSKLPENANLLLDETDAKMSIITRMELLSWAKATNEQLEVLKEFIASSTIINLAEPIILATIHLRKNYKIKLPDAIIAATALVYNFTLLTRNTKDFKKIPDLSVINPYEL